MHLLFYELLDRYAIFLFYVCFGVDDIRDYYPNILFCVWFGAQDRQDHYADVLPHIVFGDSYSAGTLRDYYVSILSFSCLTFRGILGRWLCVLLSLLSYVEQFAGEIVWRF